MPWLIVVLSVIEYYSAGVAVLAKRKGKKYWWLNLIPFVAFFYVQEYTQGFKIVMIPVKKWGQTVLIFASVALVAVLLGEASEGRFIEEQVKYIKEITYIPIAACAMFFYLGLFYSTKRIVEINSAEFPLYGLLSALILPAPFLILKQPKSSK